MKKFKTLGSDRLPALHASNRLVCNGLSRRNTVAFLSSGLYYKPMTIVNDDSRVVNKLETPLNDDARVIIYDRHMFIVPATDRR